MAKLLGEPEVNLISLKQMKDRGGNWAAYQNHELGHPHLGHLKFLKYGEGCTYFEPPVMLPDMPGEINWRYVFVGYVDLEIGEIKEKILKL